MIKVLLIDDSALALQILKRILGKAPDIVVVGTARNGREGLALVKELRPDVICTDLRMPVMDGLEFTQEVMADIPTPILVISASLHINDADNIFELMQAGALEVLPKPTLELVDDDTLNGNELIQKIRVLAGVRVIRMHKTTVQKVPLPDKLLSVPSSHAPQIIGIGASTGGPKALQSILSALPANFSIPIICVQHISVGFSAGLVNWLNQNCKLNVQFAEHGATPMPGQVYFAQDDKQLELNAQNQFICLLSTAYDGHRPSISVTLQSLALRYGNRAAGVLLTGMGRDGVDGLQAIHQVGGITIAQNEETSIVFGMPQVAIQERAVQWVLPLPQIAPALVSLLG
jgi:two-component system chemotaxis response regulator CheB